MLDPGNVLMLHPQETQGLTSQLIFFFWCRVVLGRLVGRWAAVCSCSGACLDVLLLAPKGMGLGGWMSWMAVT